MNDMFVLKKDPIIYLPQNLSTLVSSYTPFTPTQILTSVHHTNLKSEKLQAVDS